MNELKNRIKKDLKTLRETYYKVDPEDLSRVKPNIKSNDSVDLTYDVNEPKAKAPAYQTTSQRSMHEEDESNEETSFTPEQKAKIEDYVKNYKGDFKDEDIHKFAGTLKLDKHEVEEYIYSIARKNLGENINPKMKKRDLLKLINKKTK